MAITVPSWAPAKQNPSMRARSSGGDQRAQKLAAAGNVTPSPRPKVRIMEKCRNNPKPQTLGIICNTYFLTQYFLIFLTQFF